MIGHGEAASLLLLLLLYSLMNADDAGDRTAIYYDACRFLNDEVDGVAEAFEADHLRVLAQLRKASEKGGAQQ